MEMKINLQQIFGVNTSNKNQETCQQSEYNQSVQSQLYSESKSFDYQYRLNRSIFGEDSDSHEASPLYADIMQQAQTTKKAKIKQKDQDIKQFGINKFKNLTGKDSTQSKSEFDMGYISNQGSVPGQRLYYQSKTNIARKKQEIERIQQQKLNDDKKQITFKPKINPNSQKLCQRAKNKQVDHKIDKKKQQKKQVASFIKKQQQSIKQCTFKPQLISKHKSNQNKTKDQIFDGLFNQSKVKLVKTKLKAEEEAALNPKISKKLSKKQFQNFIDRNNQFINKVQKKNQLLLKTSQKFDLQTGHKMFTPKISTNAKSHSQYFITTSKINTDIGRQNTSNRHLSYSSSEQISTKPIFGKHYDELIEDSTEGRVNHTPKIRAEIGKKMKMLEKQAQTQVQHYDSNIPCQQQQSVHEHDVINEASQQDQQQQSLYSQQQLSIIEQHGEHRNNKHEYSENRQGQQCEQSVDNQQIEDEAEVSRPNIFQSEQVQSDCHSNNSNSNNKSQLSEQVQSDECKKSGALVFQISDVHQ